MKAKEKDRVFVCALKSGRNKKWWKRCDALSVGLRESIVNQTDNYKSMLLFSTLPQSAVSNLFSTDN